MGKPDKLIGNLPYSSGSAMIVNLIKENCLPNKMVFTLQKEVAERMVASPGSKKYSFFTVVCNSALHIHLQGDIGPASFFPRPEVISTIVVCTSSPLHSTIKNRPFFYELTAKLFSVRRKTIKNALSLVPIMQNREATEIEGILGKLEIDPMARVESISLQRLITLSNHLSNREYDARFGETP
jgi:16S rRNA (adenine1518-N6/adenine1519-N6)-dimethyltransferase